MKSVVKKTDLPPLSDYASVTEYLYALKAGGVKFGIDRMQRLAAALGHPERSYPVIHVAGTNGKGSVAAMLESILRASGRRTGLYTSPHLVKLGERVQVDRQLLTEAEIVAYTTELRPVAQAAAALAADEHATFFEFMTAMAFRQFQRNVSGDDCHRVRIIRTPECIEIGIIGKRIVADKRRLAVA